MKSRKVSKGIIVILVGTMIIFVGLMIISLGEKIQAFSTEEFIAEYGGFGIKGEWETLGTASANMIFENEGGSGWIMLGENKYLVAVSIQYVIEREGEKSIIYEGNLIGNEGIVRFALYKDVMVGEIELVEAIYSFGVTQTLESARYILDQYNEHLEEEIEPGPFEDLVVPPYWLVIPAIIDVDPDTLNLKSKGEWITVYIELPKHPELPEFDVSQININTVMLNNQIPAESNPKYGFVVDPNSYLMDHDDDGLLERMVKFNRTDVQNILEPGDRVKIEVTGLLFDTRPFYGLDWIRVIGKKESKGTNTSSSTMNQEECFCSIGTEASQCENPAIAPTGLLEGPVDNTPEMRILHNSPEMIEIEVDCWHVGHCWVCDEYADYDCSPFGWYGGYMEYNYGIYDGWEPCPFSDPIPVGNIVTRVEATVQGIGCPGWGGAGSMYTKVFLNGQLIGGGTQEGNCACGTCNPLTIVSPEYATGFPGYVYGGTNQLFLEIDGVSCISDVHLRFYYAREERTVSVYAVADEEYIDYYDDWWNPWDQDQWKSEVVRAVELGDDAFEREFQINFVVKEIGTWDSDDRTNSLYELGVEAIREVDKGVNDVMVAFTNQDVKEAKRERWWEKPWWKKSAYVSGILAFADGENLGTEEAILGNYIIVLLLKDQFIDNVHQHEYSHLFGAPDHCWYLSSGEMQCDPVSDPSTPCIMRYDWAMRTNNWCSSCYSTISTNKWREF